MKNTNQKHSTPVVESDTGGWRGHKTTTVPNHRCHKGTKGGRRMNDSKRGDDPLGSYWRYWQWLPMDRGGYKETKPSNSPAEPSLRKAERSFRSNAKEGENSDNGLSHIQLTDIWHKMLDEMSKKWNKQNKHGDPYTPRRLWEAYEATSMSDDDEDAVYRKRQVLAFLKSQYKNRILDFIKSSKKFVDAEKDEIIGQVTSKEPKPDDLAAHVDLFNDVRDLLQDSYRGKNLNELLAVIDALELGHHKRRDVARSVGVDVKRLAAILRTLRSLLHDWRNQLNDRSDEDKTDQEALDALSDRIKDIEEEEEDEK